MRYKDDVLKFSDTYKWLNNIVTFSYMFLLK